VAVHARIDGVPISYSTDGGLDTDKLGDYAKRKVDQKISGCIIGAIISVVALLILIAVAVYVWWAWQDSNAGSSSSASPGSAKTVSWSGKSTYTCMSGSNKIEGVTAKLKKGEAVKAMGNCALFLVDVDIQAPVAIKAMGNAKVTVIGGRITGTKHSVDAGGNAKVTLKQGAKVKGPFKKQANAKVLRQ